MTKKFKKLQIFVAFSENMNFNILHFCFYYIFVVSYLLWQFHTIMKVQLSENANSYFRKDFNTFFIGSMVERNKAQYFNVSVWGEDARSIFNWIFHGMFGYRVWEMKTDQFLDAVKYFKHGLFDKIYIFWLARCCLCCEKKIIKFQWRV